MVTNRLVQLFLTAALGVSSTSLLTADPSVDYTPITNLASATALDGNISKDDLIEVGSPAVANYTYSVTPYSNNPNGIRDGQGSNDYGDGNVTYYGDLPVTFTIDFTSPETINEIDSIAGWNNDEVGSQNLTVGYEHPGDTSFTVLGTYDLELPSDANYSMYDGVGATEVLLNITGLTNVSALDFTYNTTETYGMVLHEIDVDAPEPSTWALFAGAAALLFVLARRLRLAE